MNRSPVLLSIKIIIGTLLLFWILSVSKKGNAEEFAVPNQGSPYIDMRQVETGQIVHVPTGVRVTQAQMMDILSSARVIYIGETHDNLEAHRVQLEIIRALAEKGPIAVGMEMFRVDAQDDLDRWHWGELDAAGFKKLFGSNWGPGYRLYQPIFDFLRQKSIPLLGLKSSRAMEDQLRGKGNAPRALPELDTSDAFHNAYSMSVFGGHGDHSEALSRPYQMLLLWEETMAETVAAFVADPAHAHQKLVVLAGGFHVQYGFGVPKRAFRRTPHAYSIVLPTVTEMPVELKDREMTVKHVSIPLYMADFAWKLDYRVLPENKIKLGVRLKEEEQGVSVTRVSDASNASRAGIQVGDVLIAMNGESIAGVHDLVDRLQTFNVGDKTVFLLKRQGQDLELEVLLQGASP